MKKMLLIGDLNETLHSLSECLSTQFSVQMCSVNASDIKDMIRIIRPAILVINIYDISDNTLAVFDSLKEKHEHIPLIVIGIAQIEEKLSQIVMKFPKAIFLKRPIIANDVLVSSLELLGMGREKQVFIEGEPSIITRNRKHKIMVVDDNALVLRKVKQMLESEYDVILANSGEKALKVCMKDAPELILLDFDMPGINGKDMYEKMKENEVTKYIPVIFLTSVAQKKQTIDILRSLPAGYILKPPTKDMLFSKIREVLGE